MRAATLALGLFAAASAYPALARDSEPLAMREPDAEDVAMTPLDDLNLMKDEVPPVLLAAMSDPYASSDLSCSAIQLAIGDLDAALGPDMDIASHQGDRLSAGRVAKSVVASFIPFRGVLREISGAAERERVWRAAIYAGAVRRGFLKGLGQQQGCAYPARPAFARLAPEPLAPRSKDKRKPEPVIATPAATTFVSQPVIQPVPSTRR